MKRTETRSAHASRGIGRHKHAGWALSLSGSLCACALLCPLGERMLRASAGEVFPQEMLVLVLMEQFSVIPQMLQIFRAKFIPV